MSEKREVMFRALKLSAVLLGIFSVSCPALAQQLPTPYAGGVLRYRDIIEPKTPHEALRTFVDAWRRGDFYTAAMLIAPNRIKEINLSFTTGDFETLFPKNRSEIKDQYIINEKIEIFQKNYGKSYDLLFSIAKKYDSLPFQFGGDVKISSAYEKTDKSVKFKILTDSFPKELVVTVIKVENDFWRFETELEFWKIDEIDFQGNVRGKKPWSFY